MSTSWSLVSRLLRSNNPMKNACNGVPTNSNETMTEVELKPRKAPSTKGNEWAHKLELVQSAVKCKTQKPL